MSEAALRWAVALNEKTLNKCGMTADPILIATTQIVTAWLGSHEVASGAVPDLIQQVHASLAYREPELPAAGRMTPAKP